MKARHIKEVGVRWSLRRYWGDSCPGRGFHNAERHLLDELGVQRTIELRAAPEEAEWPTACDACGAACPDDAVKQMFPKRIYDTASGKPEPGDIFEAHWLCGSEDEQRHCISGWSNCGGKHLIALVPTGEQWHMHGRASNCTKPQDRTHRCWVLHGDPVHTASKAGNTCAAGAGSIVTPNWHGFLVNGEWRSC